MRDFQEVKGSGSGSCAHVFGVTSAFNSITIDPITLPPTEMSKNTCGLSGLGLPSGGESATQLTASSGAAGADIALNYRPARVRSVKRKKRERQ